MKTGTPSREVMSQRRSTLLLSWFDIPNAGFHSESVELDVCQGRLHEDIHEIAAA